MHSLTALLLASVLPAAALLGSAPELVGGLPKGWEPLTFDKIERHTRYSWDAEAKAVRAVSENSASGLIYRLTGSARDRSRLSWRWKVSGVLEKGDAGEKSGDDYAARIYVTFKYDPKKASFGMRVKYGAAKALYGEYPPHAGINYIWANKLPKGKAVANAYTDRVRMLALRSGPAEAGRWLREERDIVADYRELFGEAPPELAGIALMSDTDNTGERAEAWFADIELRPAANSDEE